VDPRHAQSLQTWVKSIYGEHVGIQTSFTGTPTSSMRLLEIWYLGACKDRGNENTAMAYLQDGSWGAVFPESVLKTWFEGSPGAPTGNNLYSLLGVTNTSTQEDIRTGFRRMALQWHPDRCKDPDAAEVFMKIQNAYSMLSNEDKRARYDAGLALEASIGRAEIQSSLPSGYRAPLRSGNVLVEGRQSVGRIVVETILAWDDIYNSQGQMMVSSWPMGSTYPMIAWA
jgi:hypothetical protein